MTKNQTKLSCIAFLALAGMLISFSVKADAVDAEMSQVTLFVEGMMKSRGGVTWMSWPDSVVAALSELPGIQEEIGVNLERDAFTLQYDPARVNLEQMYEAIKSLGYSPALEPPVAPASQSSETSSESPMYAALIQAADEDKLVFVDFFAEWCIACKALEEIVLAEDAVQAALEEYVFVKIDTDEYADVATEYQVVGMPTLLVLNANGDELYRSVGQVQATDLAAQLSQLTAE